jgi:hypothetical protein
MKEIDFLPEWYKSGRRRRSGYRNQYIALAGIFALMMIWNFASLNSISKATAELAKMAAKQASAQGASKEFTTIKNEITQMQKKTQLVQEIDSRIDVASVLAEMSFLIDEKIVLKKVEFTAGKMLNQQQNQPNSGSAVRVATSSSNTKQQLPLGGVRFKVVINGIAADSSDVAAFVCKLEDSPYFCQVYPSYSRNKTMDKFEISAPRLRGDKLTPAGDPALREPEAGGGHQISEFEISCYIANFRQDETIIRVKR